ncbi:protein-(glutamine-N5) methyltransferase, release factor-specific [Mesorhizobium sp. Root554]|uniref:peptide chain release factor N(5)-glutamine methyltransferase n=1 Tax=unclassified Mesorhizobium TaxID=325217 RepID=UPI0006F744D9|nr:MULTISPECIES: peptide chain release factor N(5)-glutamine methyltransferase [unclassified Mesorhizobium]KQZ14639.1 protein-(glutamine-N5) methyltransferase, release factor-specific [Mesorhizobium sp. Root1471]KQZ37147.1 protein-(glutamine-N5) methyltransferase, release factor-specific [Mesorhizobium sp. Root554]
MQAAFTLASLLQIARKQLDDAGMDSAALDARLIVEHFSRTSRTDAIVRPDLPIARDISAAVEAALDRRLAGEPVHRILGCREFYGLKLALSPDTLEPRPDTETLVDAVLPFARAVVSRQGSCRILDLGTGTGAIALALLAEVPEATANGTDISAAALATAKKNAVSLGLESRFSASESSWFAEISGRYDVIVSNPPYIPSRDIEFLQREVRDFDPRRALDGGEDGLDPYRIIADGADAFLNHGGIVAVEIGSTQNADVAQLFSKEGWQLSKAEKDLSGNDRVLVFIAG